MLFQSQFLLLQLPYLHFPVLDFIQVSIDLALVNSLLHLISVSAINLRSNSFHILLLLLVLPSDVPPIGKALRRIRLCALHPTLAPQKVGTIVIQDAPSAHDFVCNQIPATCSSLSCRWLSSSPGLLTSFPLYVVH